MSQIILCISDHPEKFSKLRKAAFVKNVTVITSCRFYHVLEYLKGPDTIIGIAIDFDMPFGTGVMFINRLIKEEKINLPPVIIVEPGKYGINKIKESFKENDFKHYISIPSNQLNWELNALRFWFPNAFSELLMLTGLIFEYDFEE